MRVLLIAANSERGDMLTLPLGAGLVAGAARRAGHEVSFIDLLGAADALAEAARAIASSAPEAIGISVRNIDDQNRQQPRFLLAQVRPVVDVCRASTSAPIILGGPGFSIFPAETLRYLGADFGVAGDGEAAFVEVLRRLEHGGDPSEVRGAYSRTRSSPPSHDAGIQALPLWDDTLTASARATGEDVWVPVQTRRGCPNDCSYCSTAAIQGRRIRTRPVERVVAELARIAAAGFRRFYVVDNSFNIPRAYALSLCGALERAALGIEWRCVLYPHRVDESLVDALSRAGCVEVGLGFESGNAEVLRLMNKRYTPADVRTACRLLERRHIRRMGFLLLGGPGETRETVEESLAFAGSLPLDALRITIGIRIYPRTALASRAAAEGIIAPGEDLLEPTFYLAPGLEPWIHERVAAYQACAPPRRGPDAPA